MLPNAIFLIALIALINADWAVEPPLPTDGTKQLQLVHALWRHGDRSPQSIFPNDPIKENEWNYGGGGLGELTPAGMRQQMELGKKLRERYVDSGFLSKYYNAKEMYVYSSPFNRTLLSAAANMVGMYSQGVQPAEQIPLNDNDESVQWPPFYVPIPVHTTDCNIEHIAVADSPCDRQTALWNLVMETPEMKEFQNSNETVSLLNYLTSVSGYTVGFQQLRSMYDTFKVEKYHNMTDKMAPFWNPGLMERMRLVNNKIQDFYDGLNLAPYQGIDFYSEIAPIRIGTLFNEMVDRMELKEECLNSNDKGCKWYKQLKYYAISGHDSTLAAYLSSLGAKDTVLPQGGYPPYASAILTELWRDQLNGMNYVKVLYMDGVSVPFKVFTSAIEGCEDYYVYCPIEKVKTLATKIRPRQPIFEIITVMSQYNNQAGISSEWNSISGKSELWITRKTVREEEITTNALKIQDNRNKFRMKLRRIVRKRQI